MRPTKTHGSPSTSPIVTVTAVTKETLVIRKARVLLSQLSKDTVEEVSRKLLALDFKNKSDIAKLAELVVDKAIINCEANAEACARASFHISAGLSDKVVIGSDRDGKSTYRRSLLNKCQEEFEKSPVLLDARSFSREAEEKRFLMRHRSIGVGKFLGELFKLNMVTEKIMHECVKAMLKNVRNIVDVNVFTACKIFLAAGRKMDRPEAKDYMDAYFDRLKVMLGHPQSSFELRREIAYVMNLREHQWPVRVVPGVGK